MKKWLKENNPLAVKLIYILTIVVYAIVIALHYLPEASNIPEFVNYLTLLNAIFNGTCFLLLIGSLVAVKKGNIALHEKLNTTAMLISVLFILSYVLNHYFKGDVVYGGEYKGLYYFVLITHILLAAMSLPFILFAFVRGMQGEIMKHKKVVRFTYPIWLYVTFTGVLVYIFLAPYY